MIVTWTAAPPGGGARYASAAVPATNTPTARTAKSARMPPIPRRLLGRPPLQIGPRPRVRLPEDLAPGVPGVQERHRGVGSPGARAPRRPGRARPHGRKEDGEEQQDRDEHHQDSPPPPKARHSVADTVGRNEGREEGDEPHHEDEGQGGPPPRLRPPAP